MIKILIYNISYLSIDLMVVYFTVALALDWQFVEINRIWWIHKDNDDGTGYWDMKTWFYYDFWGTIILISPVLISIITYCMKAGCLDYQF